MKYYKVNGQLKSVPSNTPQDKIDAWVKKNNAKFYKETEDGGETMNEDSGEAPTDVEFEEVK